MDYKVSKGASDKSLVEFKLASNSGLRRNLEQVKVYEQANDTKSSIKVIMCFSDAEHEKVHKMLRDLKLHEKESVVVIDANAENKPSGSKAS